MKRSKIRLIVAFFLVLTSLVCSISSVANAATTRYADISEYESVAELYKDYFIFGAACEAIDHWGDKSKEIGNEAKENAIATLFGSITCGNEMKPAYNFDPNSDGLFKIDHAADEMMAWATDNGVKMRGHVLVWHGQTNPAIFAKDFKAYTTDGNITTSDSAVLDENCLVDRDTLIERMRTYIRSMIEYTYANGYARTIYAWDVVNEAADEGQSDGLRRSYWYKIIGPEFLYYAFLFAREATVDFSKQYAGLYGLDADKDDLSDIRPWLFYNDYNEWYENRGAKIISFLTEVPYNADRSLSNSDVIASDGDGSIFGDGLLDGIGMQGHISDTEDIERYMRALERYSDAVGNVQITELDIGATSNGDNKWLKQAQFCYKFFSRLIEEVEKGYHLTSVTMWGLNDNPSSNWRGADYPLLLREDLSKKPAYDAVVAAAKKEPFDMTLAESIQDLSDVLIDFEPYKQNDETITIKPEDVGFRSRGTGHQSRLVLKPRVNTTPDAKIGYSLCVVRSEQDASVKFDIAKFSGSRINFKANVKTDDSNLYMGFETTDPELLATYGPYRVTDDQGFTTVEYVFDVPGHLSSAFLYFETDGASDMYFDDVLVTVTDQAVSETGLQVGCTEDSTQVLISDTTNDTEGLEVSEVSDLSIDTESDDIERATGKAVPSYGWVWIVLGIAVVICIFVVVIISKKKKK